MNLLVFVWVFCLCLWLCTMYAQCQLRSERVLDPLEGKLQIVSYCVGPPEEQPGS